jgi:hypothetical protein
MIEGREPWCDVCDRNFGSVHPDERPLLYTPLDFCPADGVPAIALVRIWARGCGLGAADMGWPVSVPGWRWRGGLCQVWSRVMRGWRSRAAAWPASGKRSLPAQR